MVEAASSAVPTRGLARWVLLAVAATVALGAWFVLRPSEEQAPSAPTFVERATCVECHADQHRDWLGSHHDRAMEVATAETVRGDFDDASFENHGVTTRFTKRDGRFFVNTQGADGAMHDYEVLYTFGWEPLQQYLIDVGDGRIQCLQVSWDTEKKRWFHIQPDKIGHDSRLHWTSMQFNWNFMCAECHSTNLDRGYDAATNGYKTTWSHIDVGCQACHGPGSGHVAWARNQTDDPTKGLVVNFKGQGPQIEIDHCARCHSRRVALTDPYEYGKPLLDNYVPNLLLEGLYHADGQILDEVYVYGSFTQTKKHAAGVRCTDCHDPHTARLKHPGNATCTHCHQPNPPEKYPVEKKVYDHPDHHFHKPGTPGSFCVDCHMPAKVYMGNDPRRDHSFRVPRPDLTIKMGTPNACDNCHADKGARWALDEIVKRHPMHVPKRVNLTHYGQVFAAARAGDPAAFGGLVKLALDDKQPAIIRATAVRYLGEFRNADTLSLVSPLIADDDDLVRLEAVRAVDSMIPTTAPKPLLAQKGKLLATALEDPRLAVRMAVARAIAGIPLGPQYSQREPAFRRALKEYMARQRAYEDRPDSQLNLATLAEAAGEVKKAAAAYKRALTLDPHFQPARFNLAMLYNRMGRNKDAECLLEEVVERDPGNGEGWYSLGLLRAEVRNDKGAAQALARASGLMPRRARVRYNYGQALKRLGQVAEADEALTKAHELDPEDPDIINALAGASIERGGFDRAEALAKKLDALGPQGMRAATTLRRQIERARGR